MLTERQRVLAAFLGQPLDRFPVAVPYIFLLQCDHRCEITGQPAWTYYDWLVQEPEQHVAAYADFHRQLPFDILQPHTARSREERERLEVVRQEGRAFYRDRQSGALHPLNEDLPHNAAVANQTRYVWDEADTRERVRVPTAEEIVTSGRHDYISAARRAYPDRFLMMGVVGTFWQCTAYVGEAALFALLYDEPALIESLSARLLERTIAEIRALVAAGCDAIYIDDALTTSDLISVGFYERFSWPYVRAMVEEIHRLGRQAVLIYFGGVMDRLPQIMALDGDALNVETSMKGYINDLDAIERAAAGRLCLWGNLDPIGLVQEGSDDDLRRAMAQQVEVGRRAGRFLISTGSPITPLTSLPRIRRFIELGHELGAADNIRR